MTRFRLTILALTIAAVAAAVSLLMQHRTRAMYRENERVLRQQDRQLAELLFENQRLSNAVVEASNRPVTVEDSAAELAQLRSKITVLQQQADELAREREERRRLATRMYSEGDSNLLDHGEELAISYRRGPRPPGYKQSDARGLTDAVLRYAEQHEGQFPLSFDDVREYLPKPLTPDSPSWANAPLTGTNHFEIVFQGSTNDLANLPPRRIALIREQQPWPTDDGKLARVYGYADGAVSVVKSDDNFRSWDAQHIIPPPGRH